MLKIQLNNRELIVTQGAYDSIYKKQGYTIVTPQRVTKVEKVKDVEFEEVKPKEVELKEVAPKKEFSNFNRKRKK